MLKEVLTVSALIAVVLLVRAIFKNRVPKRMIYCLWLVVLLKLCLPGTLFSLPVLPAEKLVAPTQISELPAQTTPVIQQPAQTVMQPQTPAQQQVSPAFSRQARRNVHLCFRRGQIAVPCRSDSGGLSDRGRAASGRGGIDPAS